MHLWTCICVVKFCTHIHGECSTILQELKKLEGSPLAQSSNHHSLLLLGGSCGAAARKRLDWKDPIPVSALLTSECVIFRKSNSLKVTIYLRGRGLVRNRKMLCKLKVLLQFIQIPTIYTQMTCPIPLWLWKPSFTMPFARQPQTIILYQTQLYASAYVVWFGLWSSFLKTYTHSPRLSSKDISSKKTCWILLMDSVTSLCWSPNVLLLYSDYKWLRPAALIVVYGSDGKDLGGGGTVYSLPFPSYREFEV